MFLRGFLGLIEDCPVSEYAYLDDVVVETEETTEDKGRIDILLSSEINNFVVAIENKTFTTEHDNQLSRYFGYIEERYPEKEKYYVYLTPRGDSASNADNWQSISYAQIAELLDKCLAAKKDNLSSDAEMVVRHYIEAVREDVLGESPVERVAKEIYSKHRLALEAIFKWRPDDIAYAMDRVARVLSSADGGAKVLEDSRSEVRFCIPSMKGKDPLYANSFFLLASNEDNVELSFRYPRVDRMSSEEIDLRYKLIEALGGNPDDEHFLVDDEFSLGGSVSDLVSGNEEYLRIITEAAIQQAEEFIEMANSRIG